jgi:hypothetical protein
MFAPAPVAALLLSWAYLTATLMALPVTGAGQNLCAALSATIPTIHIRQRKRRGYEASGSHTFRGSAGG